MDPLLVSSVTELKKKEKQQKKAKSGGFESLGLSLNVFRGVKRKGYKVPTPIQRKTMPLILSGSDVVAMARTGSGKTAAFLVPMLEKLRNHLDECGGVRALILSPTRDLALQTLKFAQELGRYTDLRISLLVGGDSMESQFEELAQNPDIIIATPGRLMHHLSEVEDMSLRSVEYVVFDEADCIFSMGFAEQLHQILEKLNPNRQTLLFSATLPSALAEFAKAGLRDAQLVRLDLETKISPALKLVFFTLRQEEKHAALLYLIQEMIKEGEQTLIFVSTKYHVEFLNVLCQQRGINPSVCYGDMDQDARKMHVSRFRSRKTMLLIVTDVAARGIDIPLLDNVINWDFPPRPKLFVHRVGRAARAGRTGTAFSFVTNEDMPHVLDLHLFLSKPIRAAPTEEEVSHDVNNLTSKIDQAIANGETIYGRFPQEVLDLNADKVRELLDSSTELHSLERPCAKAFRLYYKTKAKPSKESVRRAKKLPRDGLHPIFKGLLGSREISALAFLENLKTYRPKQTILEAEGEVAKSKKVKANKRKFELVEDDEPDCGFGNEENSTKSLGMVKIRDNSDRAFYKELAKVIEASDVILEVLDARDPIGTRCADVEKMVLRAGYEKHLVLLLNKIDLVPREAVEKWLKYLREELPTVAFKCSTQEQRSNLGWKSAPKAAKAAKVTAKPGNLLQISDCLGAETLIKLLKNYSRSHEIKKSITVGVVGLPNVGKSSLINSLRRCHVVNVGATPGLTRSMQEVQLDKNVKLLDCPGVVMARSGESDASIALRNCKRIEKLEDPAGPVKEILNLCPAETLAAIYKIPNFDSADEFLQNVATARGKLKKGGIIDVDAAARIVLHDWNKGKIPYYTMPPTRDAGVHSEAKIISKLGKEFNIDEVYGTESFIGSLKSADDFQPSEMLASATITPDEKMTDEKMTEVAMQGNKVVDQNNDNNDECMAEEDGADVNIAQTASGRQNVKLYATKDVLNTKIRKAEKRRMKKAKKLSAMEAKMESDDIEDLDEDAAMDDVDEDQLVVTSSKNKFEIPVELDE